MQKFQQRVKSEREGKGWSKAKLADMIGVTRGAISNIENGWSNPSPETGAKIYKALGIPEEEALIDMGLMRDTEQLRSGAFTNYIADQAEKIKDPKHQELLADFLKNLIKLEGKK